MRRLLTRTEVCEILQVAPMTVRRLEQRGQLPRVEFAFEQRADDAQPARVAQSFEELSLRGHIVV